MHLRLQANPALRHCFAVLPAAYADRLRAEAATAVRPIVPTHGSNSNSSIHPFTRAHHTPFG